MVSITHLAKLSNWSPDSTSHLTIPSLSPPWNINLTMCPSVMPPLPSISHTSPPPHAKHLKIPDIKTYHLIPEPIIFIPNQPTNTNTYCRCIEIKAALINTTCLYNKTYCQYQQQLYTTETVARWQGQPISRQQYVCPYWSYLVYAKTIDHRSKNK